MTMLFFSDGRRETADTPWPPPVVWQVRGVIAAQSDLDGILADLAVASDADQEERHDVADLLRQSARDTRQRSREVGRLLMIGDRSASRTLACTIHTLRRMEWVAHRDWQGPIESDKWEWVTAVDPETGGSVAHRRWFALIEDRAPRS